jgi:starch phosphorylase
MAEERRLHMSPDFRVAPVRRRRESRGVIPPISQSDPARGTVAYFSMEIALAEGMPTYAGGLGVLAGDTLRAAADLNVDMVAVTLLHRKGYFHQRLDAMGRQAEQPEDWSVADFVNEEPVHVPVTIDGRTVHLRSWRYTIRGITGVVPVFFLDADLPENTAEDRTLTHWLYGGDSGYRLRQEVILGIGGVRMLRALGYESIRRFHMNEGHSSLLVTELLAERARAFGRTTILPEDVAEVRRLCVFTTHTPVAAGQDKYPPALAAQIVGDGPLAPLLERCYVDGLLNLTMVGHAFSHYVNGVAMKNAEIERKLLDDTAVDAITNGVHATTWTAPEIQALFDRHIPGWQRDNFSLRYALSIPREEIAAAHVGAKQRLLARIASQGDTTLKPDVFTLGFARRATAYKRADLLLRDLERLKQIAATRGPVQIVYAGKAHPRDSSGKQLIEAVIRAREALRGRVPVVYLENYDVDLAKLVTAGVDVWLNTPVPPLEASGTSGMKAALNGVPSLSVLDGWWIEGHVEGVTGWSVGEPDGSSPGSDRDAADAESLYRKLEEIILPLYYARDGRFVEVMCRAIALNGSFFNSQRMVEEYEHKAYAE